ncbi:MAG TPA: MgtC/SapB family protein [Planctomycetota bacterium]|nr:MgtC/SapB family protein [Planctomycetota bacterium]
MEHLDWVVIGKLGMAAVLGGLIGFERELHSQPAGLRTHMLVAIGSCLIMLVSLYMWEHVDRQKADPGRIAAQVVAGIGFLGAGAIMRFGMSVRGLTTAACLWTAAGIGLAVGAGFWVGALGATLFTLLTAFAIDRIEKAFFIGKAYRRFVIHLKDAPGLVGRIEAVMEQAGLGIKEVDIQRDLVEHKLQITLTATCPRTADVEALSHSLGRFSEVEKVEIG